MLKSIASFFLSLWISFLSLFGISSGKKSDFEIKTLNGHTDFYVDGVSANGLLSYGVAGNTNLFSPGETITAIIECSDTLLYGTGATVTISCDQTGFSKSGSFSFGKSSSQYSFGFSSDLNGIFDISLKTAFKTYSWDVAVMPKNETASDAFYYGIQPYITRAQCWGENYRIPGRDADESITEILDTAGYMGINLIREDGISWSGMQSSPYGDVDFTAQDNLIQKVTGRGIKYNWILGGGTSEWSVSSAYKNNYDASMLWSYAPEEIYWDDYVTKLADHYASDKNILWEVWNEPNWSFFTGTDEEYFILLESTAKIIKSKNSNAYVYSGGLAVAEQDGNASFWKKSAELISEGLLDNWGYHNHDGENSYRVNMTKMLENAGSQGLKGGGFNSESGVGGTDASMIARKALYTRSTGGAAYVSFSFRKDKGSGEEVNNFAFFDEYLQPTDAVITYSTVIRFLGQAEYVGNNSADSDVVYDEYRTQSGKVMVYYAFNKTDIVNVPDGAKSAYDMYGNPITLGSTLTVSNEPVYIIF